MLAAVPGVVGISTSLKYRIRKLVRLALKPGKAFGVKSTPNVPVLAVSGFRPGLPPGIPIV